MSETVSGPRETVFGKANKVVNSQEVHQGMGERVCGLGGRSDRIRCIDRQRTTNWGGFVGTNIELWSLGVGWRLR